LSLRHLAQAKAALYKNKTSERKPKINQRLAGRQKNAGRGSTACADPTDETRSNHIASFSPETV
jgi:hypothetical protein